MDCHVRRGARRALDALLPLLLLTGLASAGKVVKVEEGDIRGAAVALFSSSQSSSGAQGSSIARGGTMRRGEDGAMTRGLPYMALMARSEL